MGNSRWSPSTQLPSYIRRQAKKAATAQLMQEAQSMTPNENELTKMLMSRKLAPKDMEAYGETLKGGLNEYLTKYRENPFFAFTREGINHVRSLQQIVTDPNLSGLEDSYAKSEKIYDRASDSGLNDKLNVQNGMFRVFDKNRNELKWISPSEYDSNKHAPLSVDDEYHVRTRIHGFASDPTPFSVDMRKYDDVQTSIMRYFQGLGETESERLVGDLKLSNKNNYNQIESRLKAISSDMGLSDTDKNTLMSEFYKGKIMRGEKMSDSDSNVALSQMISSIAEGYIKTGNSIAGNPQESMNIQRESLKTTQLSKMGLIFNQKPVQTHVRIAKASGGSRGTSLPTYEIPPILLNESSSTYQVEKGGPQNPKRNMMDLEKNIYSTASGTSYVMSMKDGSLNPLPTADIKGEIQVLDAKGTTVPFQINPNGQKVYVSWDSPEGQDAIQKGQYERAVLTQARMMGARNPLSGEDSRYANFSNTMMQSGYDVKNPNKDSQTVQEYQLNVNSAFYDEPGFGSGWIPGSGVNPDMYDFWMVTPLMGDENMLGLSENKTGFQPKEYATYNPSQSDAVDATQTNPFLNKMSGFDSLK